MIIKPTCVIKMKKKKKFKIEIANDECKGCGRCIYSCPVQALKKTKSVNSMGYVYTEYVSKCIGCGSCFYACPEPGAITVIEIVEDNEDK